MYAKATSSAQTEDKRGRELAHRNVYLNGCIGRQPASEGSRRFSERALLFDVVGSKRRQRISEEGSLHWEREELCGSGTICNQQRFDRPAFCHIVLLHWQSGAWASGVG